MNLRAGTANALTGPQRGWRLWGGLVAAGVAGFALLGQIVSQADDVTASEIPLVTHVAEAGRASGKLLSVALTPSTLTTPDQNELVEIEAAQLLIARAQAKYDRIRDYSCVFHKRERINGRLMKPGQMSMKARTTPTSLYFKFEAPNRGREAIYIEGKNDGKILAHDVGVLKLLGGTMWLDPKGSMAMTENRHPITEAGLGELIKTVTERWSVELSPEFSDVTIETGLTCVGRSCTMVDSTHPVRRPEFFFYKVRLFFDDETHLPIRFEAYDWPSADGTSGDMLEEYTYEDLKTDVGLTEADFDASNPVYSFGRF